MFSTVALKTISNKNNPERRSKIKPFIDKYNWKEISFLSQQKDWKTFDSNTKSISLNIFYFGHNNKEIRHEYKSKDSLKRENQVILVMIIDSEKWHYLAVKKLFALFRGVTPKHDRDFYCLIFFHFYTTKNKLEKHDQVCKNHDYFYVEIPNEDNKILK